MPKLVISAGHNEHVVGAHGYGQEENEAREVVKDVIHFVKKAGWEAVDATDNKGTTQLAILRNAVAKHNAHPNATCDVQIHFNSFNKKARGVEAFVASSARKEDRARAIEIVNALSKRLGIPSRGVKNGDNLYFCRNTKYGILVEVAFIDNKADWDAYTRYEDDEGHAIAQAITGKKIVFNDADEERKAEEVKTNKKIPAKKVQLVKNIHTGPIALRRVADFDGKVESTLKKNIALTIVKKVKAKGGGEMYLTAAGWYVTASTKYVKVIDK